MIQLVLEKPQATLDNNVLKDRPRRHVNGAALVGNDNDGTLKSHVAAKVDGTGDSKMVEFKNPRNAGNTALEVRDLLVVRAELDKRSRSEASRVNGQFTVLQRIEVGLDKNKVGASLDGQEALARNIDTVGILEVPNSGTDSSLELKDTDVRLTLADGDGLGVGNNLELKLAALDNTLDSLQVEPNVVGVEVLELLNGLELLNMFLGNLSNFEKPDSALVVNDGTTLDISLGLVGQLHNVLGISVDHVLEDVEIDDCTKIVNVGEEEVLNSTLEEVVKSARVVQGLEHVTVSGRIPVGDGRFVALGNREERILVDTGIPRLVESDNVDIVTLVLLDNVLRIVVGVERVHKNEWYAHVVLLIKVLNLTDGQVQEGHAIPDFDHGLGTDTSHRSTETTIELEDGKLVKNLWVFGLGKIVVCNDLGGVWWGNTVPIPRLESVTARVLRERHSKLTKSNPLPYPEGSV